MKKSTRVAGFLGLAAALLLITPAVAQQSTYTIRVPFQFSVGARAFPAGEYRVGAVAGQQVEIRSIDTAASAMFATGFVSRSSRQPLNGQLVFHQYGTQYFLSQVWFEDMQKGYQLPVSSNERDYAKRTRGSDTILRARK